jgi:hypothetical protein
MRQTEIDDAEWQNPRNWHAGFYFSRRDSRSFVEKASPPSARRSTSRGRPATGSSSAPWASGRWSHGSAPSHTRVGEPVARLVRLV